MKKLKAAVWGVGGIGQAHIRALQKLGIEIALIASNNEDEVKGMAAKYDIPHFTTSVDEIVHSDVDCVHVCTPPNLHYDQLHALLSEGKNVIAEKPLCFENKQAQDLCELASKNNCLTAVDFNVRFHDAVQTAHNVIIQEDFGSIQLVHGTYLQEYHMLPAPLDWRYNPQMAGSMRAMTEIGSHWLDLAQFLTRKKITAISALFQTFEPERNVVDRMMYAPNTKSSSEHIHVQSEDVALLQMRFEDNTIGSVVLSEVSPGRSNHLSIEVTGTHKSVWWNSEENTKLCIGEKGNGFLTKLYPFGNGFDDTLLTLFTRFYADVASGSASSQDAYPTLQDAMQNVVLCNAAHESALQNGNWISIATESEKI